MKAAIIVISVHLKISALFVVSHGLSAKVSPEWRSNPGFGTQTHLFSLNRGVPSIEVTDTKIMRTFLRDQILFPLNGIVPNKGEFNYFLYFRLTCGCPNNDSAIEL